MCYICIPAFILYVISLSLLGGVAVANNLPHLNSCRYGQHPVVTVPGSDEVVDEVVVRWSKIGILCIITRRNNKGSERGLTPSNILEKYCTYLHCDAIVK